MLATVVEEDEKADQRIDGDGHEGDGEGRVGGGISAGGDGCDIGGRSIGSGGSDSRITALVLLIAKEKTSVS